MKRLSLLLIISSFCMQLNAMLSKVLIKACTQNINKPAKVFKSLTNKYHSEKFYTSKTDMAQNGLMGIPGGIVGGGIGAFMGCVSGGVLYCSCKIPYNYAKVEIDFDTFVERGLYGGTVIGSVVGSAIGGPAGIIAWVTFLTGSLAVGIYKEKKEQRCLDEVLKKYLPTRYALVQEKKQNTEK